MFVLINLLALLCARVFAATPIPSRLVARSICTALPAGGPDIAIRNEIVQIAFDLDVTDKVMIAMMEAAIQASDINNLDCGVTSANAYGVFQLGVGDGWGTQQQIMNVEHATEAFLDVAIEVNNEDPSLSPGLLAERVLLTTTGDVYDQYQAEAEQYIAEAEAALGLGGSVN